MPNRDGTGLEQVAREDAVQQVVEIIILAREQDAKTTAVTAPEAPWVTAAETVV